MKHETQLMLLVGILVVSSFLLTFYKKGTIETKAVEEVDTERIESIAREVLESFPDVSFLEMNYTITWINETPLFGYKFYEVKGKIGDRDFVFYISKDLKNIVFKINYQGRNLLEFVDIDTLKESMKAMLPKKSKKPEVKLFIMSFCPFGNQMETAMKEVLLKIGDKIDFEPVYIYYPGERYNNDPKFCALAKGDYYCSMHGIKELEQDLREKAIYNIYGTKTWAEYVSKVDSRCSRANIDSCWKEVAEEMGLSVEDVERYVEENRENMLVEDYKLSQKYNAWASPTLIVNGMRYNYPRQPKYIMKFICKSFEKEPEECKENISSKTMQTQSSGFCG